jgi:cell division protein FtsQ
LERRRERGELSAARRLFLAGGAVALVTGGWLLYGWFRDSSLVRVRHVEITGLDTRDAPRIRKTLRETATRMTTLHVRADQLKRAVEPYATVKGLEVSARFPTKLRIDVEQYVPVAVVVTGERRISVAADGTLLPHMREDKLPTIQVSGLPALRNREGGKALALVSVLGRAPARLRSQLSRAYATRDGVLVAMRDGPTLQFGSMRRLNAKWAAATRILASESAVGADAIDVRLPERPVARGFAASGVASVVVPGDSQL